ncbi:MAG: hypothetical protein M3Q81_03525 [bacterium]|nr:hypothetical protein [bacterium]
MKITKDVKKFTFEGTETLIEVTTVDNANRSGKVIAMDDTIIALDEHYPQDPGRFARTYIYPSQILCITVGGTWLNIIARSIAGTY